jgi:hypothetical protein
LRTYLKRLAIFPLLTALVAVAEAGKAFWHFDVETKRAYEEGRGRGAPPLDRLPSRRTVLVLVAGAGALRGLGFALVRPALPRRPEAAALLYSALGAAGLTTGFQLGARVARARVPTVIWRATVTTIIERAISRQRD